MMDNFPKLIKSVAEKLAQGESVSVSHQQEALWIVQHALKDLPLAEYNRRESAINSLQINRINELLKRRIEMHEPIGYMFGTVPFCALEIKVRPPILIPRMETEEWALMLIEKMRAHNFTAINILDLCTGSGCIALALASAFPQAKVIGVDVNPAAIELARENAEFLNLKNVSFLEKNIFEDLALDVQFDVIVSNPPYVTASEWAGLVLDVKNWEDKIALVAEENGLIFYPQIASIARRLLKSAGTRIAVVEVGATQANEVVTMFAKEGFFNHEIFKDLFGQDRAIFFELR